MQITVLFTSMLATMDQMGTVVSLRTVPLEKLLLVNSWIYQDQRDCQDTQRGVLYPTALWQMRHSPSGWISCDPTPVAKGRTGCPMINPFSTTGSVGQGGIVENAFGILAQRFRVFDRRLQIYDHNVIKIINATCVLHNYLCTARLDVANMMGRLNPDGVPYLQPQAMLRDLQNQGYHSTDAAQSPENLQGLFQLRSWGSSLAGESH